MRIVCISDTHMQRPEVPNGDMLIHAGDLTTIGCADQLHYAAEWLHSLPHRHKVVISGNHDWLFQAQPSQAREILGPSITYLQDELTEIEGFRVYGSPWQPYFQGWAFNLQRSDLAAKWAMMPSGIDILVTHGPPMGAFDQCHPTGERLGCAALTEALDRIKPSLHVFGHIHPGHGWTQRNGRWTVNAAICRDDGQGLNRAVVVDIQSK